MMNIEYYMSKKNGNLVTWDEMMADLSENFDINDPTNWLGWTEYYIYYGPLV